MLSFALVILAQTSAPEDWIRPERLERVQRAGGRNGSGLAWFEFAPASGAGLVSAANLCDTLTAAEKVGNWWCLNGDETQAGAIALTEVGTVTPQSDRTCPNGSDCAAITGFRTTGSNYYETPASTASPSGDFTVCGVGVLADRIGMVADKATGGTDIVFRLFGNTVSAMTGQVCKASASCTSVSSPAIYASGRHLVCLVYDYVTDGTSTLRAWTDGTGGAASTTAVGPPLSNTIRVRVGTNGIAPSSDTWAGPLQGVFFTESALSDARIAAIARAVLADAPTGARGEALSETRASVQFCESSDGTGTLLPNNRLCVTRGGTTAAQGAFTQYALRTEELDNAGWTKAGSGVAAPTVTGNYAVSPGGTMTAERVQVAACPAVSNYSAVYQLAAATGASKSSVWCKSNTGSDQTISICTNDVDGSGHCTPITCTTSWQRLSDSHTIGGASGGIVFGCDNEATYAGSSNTGAADVLLWGANLVASASLRPYIPATTASVLTAAEVPYFTLTNAPALKSFEATIDTPASIPSTMVVATFNKDASNEAAIVMEPGNLRCGFIVGGIPYNGNSAGAVPTSTLGVRLSCSYDGTNIIACVNGTCTNTAQSFTQFSGATRAYIGSYTVPNYETNPSPVIKSVKADPNGARFR